MQERQFLTQIDDDSTDEQVKVVADHIKDTLERAGITVLRE